MDYNRETILDELNDFEKRLNEISPVLEDYLLKIARTGDTMFPWVKLKPLLRKKLELVLDDFYETCPTDNLPPLPNVEPFKFEILKTKILEALDLFHSAPFTIQRLCELLTTPRKHYKRTDKFMRGLEKNVLVVSTVEPKSRFDNEVNNNNNNNSSAMMNGLINVGTNDQQSEKESSSPSIAHEMKMNNSSSQFDNFNVLSSSPSIIITEIPGTSQADKTESDAHDVNSNSTSVGNNNTNEMDVSNYRDSRLSEENSSSRHNNHQKSNLSNPDASVGLNNSNHSSLENFSVFTSPSSVGVSNLSNVQQTEKCNAADCSKNFKSRSNEREIDLSRFQDSCDNHLTENAMDVAPSVSERSTFSEETHHKSTSASSRPPLPDNKDMCCQPAQQSSTSVYPCGSENFAETSSLTEVKEENLAEDNSASDEVSNNQDDKRRSCKGSNENDDSVANSQTNSQNTSKKTASLDGFASQNHAMQSDSSVENTVINRASKRAEDTSEQDIMDLEPPSKNVHPEFTHGNSTTNMNESEAMEQD